MSAYTLHWHILVRSKTLYLKLLRTVLWLARLLHKDNFTAVKMAGQGMRYLVCSIASSLGMWPLRAAAYNILWHNNKWLQMQYSSSLSSNNHEIFNDYIVIYFIIFLKMREQLMLVYFAEKLQTRKRMYHIPWLSHDSHIDSANTAESDSECQHIGQHRVDVLT